MYFGRHKNVGGGGTGRERVWEFHVHLPLVTSPDWLPFIIDRCLQSDDSSQSHGHCQQGSCFGTDAQTFSRRAYWSYSRYRLLITGTTNAIGTKSRLNVGRSSRRQTPSQFVQHADRLLPRGEKIPHMSWTKEWNSASLAWHDSYEYWGKVACGGQVDLEMDSSESGNSIRYLSGVSQTLIVVGGEARRRARQESTLVRSSYKIIERVLDAMEANRNG